MLHTTSQQHFPAAPQAPPHLWILLAAGQLNRLSRQTGPPLCICLLCTCRQSRAVDAACEQGARLQGAAAAARRRCRRRRRTHSLHGLPSCSASSFGTCKASARAHCVREALNWALVPRTSTARPTRLPPLDQQHVGAGCNAMRACRAGLAGGRLAAALVVASEWLSSRFIAPDHSARCTESQLAPIARLGPMPARLSPMPRLRCLPTSATFGSFPPPPLPQRAVLLFA